MKQIQLEANLRTSLKKNALHRLRKTHKVPAVLYGRGEPSLNLELDDHRFQQLLHSLTSRNVLIQLTILGDQAPRQEIVMIKELQRHPVTANPVHVDFMKISMDQTLETTVPIKITGIAAGIKEGGVLEQIHRELAIRCLPAFIPDSITLDVTPLMIGQSIIVANVPLPEGIQVLVDGHEPVVHVIAPRKEEEKPVEEVAAAVAGVEEVQQPEVIGEKERELRRAEREKEKEKRE